MSRKQLYELRCERCGHEQVSEDYGLDWGQIGAIGSRKRDSQSQYHFPSVVGVLKSPALGGGPKRRGALICPDCSDAFFTWWEAKGYDIYGQPLKTAETADETVLRVMRPKPKA